MTRRKAPHEKLKPGRKPGVRLTQAAVQSAPALPQVVPGTTPAVEARANDPLQRHRHIGSMGEAELRAYALQVGVNRRDAESLPVERLRVNCHHVLHALIDDL